MEKESTTWPTFMSTVSKLTSSSFVLLTSEQNSGNIENNKKNFRLEDSSLIFGGPGVKNPILDPFKMEIPSTESGNFSGVNLPFYKTFYISRAVIVPATLSMIFCSIILIYIILRHLKSVLKLYLSVLFYAFSILFFASQIITKLLHNLVSGETLCLDIPQSY